MQMEEKEIREENRKIRFLRYLVDFSLLSIQQEDLTLEEVFRVVEDVKRAACNLFPGKEETFELIYRPRFNRVIQERFGVTSLIS
jgi:ubiquinone/menaquinone biosynthesis C-methylase UbiE